MSEAHAPSQKAQGGPLKIGFRDISRDSDVRSFIGALLPPFPSGHSAPVFYSSMTAASASALPFLNSFPFDWQVRTRGGAAHLIWSMLSEMSIPRMSVSPDALNLLGSLSTRLNLWKPTYAPALLSSLARIPKARRSFAIAPGERCRLRGAVDGIAAAMYGCDRADIDHILRDVDLPVQSIKRGHTLDVRGFWRVDRTLEPELRHSVLTIVAFRDLDSRIRAAGGNRAKGVQDFLAQNQGDGWLVPETLRLSDFDLGHDDRARDHQPVACRLGPRFEDWQLTQSRDESWRECHLHARNLFGRVEYVRLLDRLIEHRVLSGDQHHDLLFGRFTRSLAQTGPRLHDDDPYSNPEARELRRVAELRPGYSARSGATKLQTELLPPPQTDLFG